MIEGQWSKDEEPDFNLGSVRPTPAFTISSPGGSDYFASE
jgi:hypothetical protein